MLNNIGPGTLPCVTPLVIVCHPEKESPTFTLRVLPLRSCANKAQATILKIVRFQRLHFTSKSKGYLLYLTEEGKKATKPKEQVVFSLKSVKFVKK